MGYSRFDGNEEDTMECFLKQNPINLEEFKGYEECVNSLLRRKFLMSDGKNLFITDRGKSAIIQQIKTGNFWVSPLRPYKPKEPKFIISKELSGYVKGR